MSRAKRLQVTVALAVLVAVYLFHSRYEIVVRGSGGGGGSGARRQQRAGRAGSPDPDSSDVRTTEKHVGAEDPAGHVFVPTGGPVVDGGGDGLRRNVSSTHTHFNPV